TDAFALTRNPNRTFVAMATIFSDNGHLVIASDTPATFELSGDTIKYYRDTSGILTVGRATKPFTITLNGAIVKRHRYDRERHAICIDAPKGEGSIIIK